MMNDKKINDYLTLVQHSLKHLTISEKEDIINEIKSHIREVQVNQNKDMDVIIQELGDPYQLGKAYTENTISTSTEFNIGNLFRKIYLWGAFGVGGLFLSILTGSLYLCAFLILVGGSLKTLGAMLGYDMRFIIIRFGSWLVPDMLALPISIPLAVMIYLISYILWKRLKNYSGKTAVSIKQEV